jgi:hypothetical protein
LDEPKVMQIELMEAHEFTKEVVKYTDEDILSILELIEKNN